MVTKWLEGSYRSLLLLTFSQASMQELFRVAELAGLFTRDKGIIHIAVPLVLQQEREDSRMESRGTSN